MKKIQEMVYLVKELRNEKENSFNVSGRDDDIQFGNCDLCRCFRDKNKRVNELEPVIHPLAIRFLL